MSSVNLLILKSSNKQIGIEVTQQFHNMKTKILPIVLVSGPPSLCLLSDLIGVIRKFELNGENCTVLL